MRPSSWSWRCTPSDPRCFARMDWSVAAAVVNAPRSSSVAQRIIGTGVPTQRSAVQPSRPPPRKLHRSSRRNCDRTCDLGKPREGRSRFGYPVCASGRWSETKLISNQISVRFTGRAGAMKSAAELATLDRLEGRRVRTELSPQPGRLKISVDSVLELSALRVSLAHKQLLDEMPLGPVVGRVGRRASSARGRRGSGTK